MPPNLFNTNGILCLYQQQQYNITRAKLYNGDNPAAVSLNKPCVDVGVTFQRLKHKGTFKLLLGKPSWTPPILNELQASVLQEAQMKGFPLFPPNKENSYSSFACINGFKSLIVKVVYCSTLRHWFKKKEKAGLIGKKQVRWQTLIGMEAISHDGTYRCISNLYLCFIQNRICFTIVDLQPEQSYIFDKKGQI